jgi:uncharacterized protein YlxW (UPF0749 family)
VEVTVRVLVPGVALLAGLLFATSAHTAQGTDLRAGRRLQLTELIGQQRGAVDRQERQAAALRREVADATARAAERGAVASRDRAGDRALEVAAGLTPVTGPSMTVHMDDAPHGDPPPGSTPDDLVVHQQDVQAVVNALWAGGAEAMTLMGQRVIATSAVRCVGNTLILHGRVYSPPFVVTAVGDVGGMRRALDLGPGVQLFLAYVERYGLGYEVTKASRTRLPAYAGPLELPAATGTRRG